MEDTDIRDMVKRLSRPHKSGGAVIERAAILAEGADSMAVLAWITSHEGRPEEAVTISRRGGGGLHGSRFAADEADRVPSRYVLPASALA